MIFKTVKTNISKLIEYQQWLAKRNHIQLTSWQALTAGITSTTKAMGKWLVTSPAGWLVLLTSAVAGLVGAFDLLTTSTEEHMEKLSTLKQDYSEIKSELNSLNEEFSTTANKIKELEGKDNLSFTEEKELERLQKQNNELQRSIDLLELEEKQAAKATNKEFIDTMESERLSTKSVLTNELDSRDNAKKEYITEDEYTNRQFSQLKELKTELANTDVNNKTSSESLQTQIANIEEYLQEKYTKYIEISKDIEYINTSSSESEKSVNENLDYINDFQDKMAIIMGGENAEINAFNRIVDNWKFDEVTQELQTLGEAGKVTASMLNDPKYDEFIQKLAEIGVINSVNNLTDIAKAFNSVADSTSSAAQEFNNFYIPLDTTEAIENLAELEKNMLELDSVITSLADGKKVDLSSLDGIRESFAELENADLSIINDSLEQIANANSIEEAQSALSNLAEEYLKTSGILTGINEENANLIANQLKSIGITNADAIVTSRLTINKQLLENQEKALSAASQDLTDKQNAYKAQSTQAVNTTYQQSAAFLEQATMSNLAKVELANLIAEQQIFNTNSGLNVSEQIANLELLATHYMGTAAAAAFLNKVQVKDGGAQNHYETISPEEAWKQTVAEFSKLETPQLNYPTTPTASKTSTTSNSAGSTPSPTPVSTAIEETKNTFYEVIDWMERKITALERVATKAINRVKNSLVYAMDNAFVSKTMQKLNTQMKQNAYMAKRYQSSADFVDLPQEWKDKIKNGTTIDYDHIHDENLSKKIKEYEDWYKKSLDCAEANEQLKDTVKELSDAIAQAPIEKYAAKVEKYKSSTKLLDAKIDNATSAAKKNSLINKKADKIDLTKDAYEDAYTATKKNLSTYSKKITKQKVSGKATDKQKNTFKKLMAKIKSLANQKPKKKIGDKTLNAIYDYCNSIGSFSWYENCVAYNSAVEANTAAKETYDLYKQTAKQEKANLAKQQFDNIAAGYDNKISANEQTQTSINNRMSLAEEQGEQVTTGYYKDLLSAESEKQKQLIAKRDALQKSLDDAVSNGTIKIGSEEWYEMVAAINAVQNEIDESNIALERYANAQRQLRWDAFDKALEKISQLHDETGYFMDLLSSKELVDENGLTEYGDAALSLYKTNYESYLAQAKSYANEYQALMDAIARGEESATDENVINRLKELQAAERDAISAANAEKDAIVDLVVNGYDALLDSLSEMISKYKDWLSAQKDAYDYQRTIEDKVKNISALQKQLDAYGANDTEEARAKVQKIQLELADARKDLEETQYDKYISDTNTMLDDLYDQLEGFFDEKLNQTNVILSSIDSNNSAAATTLQSLLNEFVGTEDTTGISQTLQSILAGQTTAGQHADTTVNNSKNAAESDHAPAPSAPAANTASQPEEALIHASDPSARYTSRLDSISNLSLQDERIKSLAEDFIAKHASKAKKKKSEYSAVNEVIYEDKAKLYSGTGKVLSADELKQLARIVGVTYDGGGKNKALYKKLAALGIKGFADGSKNIARNQLALLAEEGAELHFDESQGVLKTIASGDKVFTTEMTNRLWELAQANPMQLIPNITIPEFVPMEHTTTENIHTDIQLSISLPNVADYADFKSELIKDKTFEKAIQSMTVDRMLGANSLSKNNFT